MQDIVLEEPYEFVPPIESDFWCWLLRFRFPSYMRKTYLIESSEVRGAERLRSLLDEGKSVMMLPNHSRLSDPMALGFLSGEAKCNLFAMASWHIFKEDAYSRFMIRRMGGFSIYREGNDRQALDTAIDILVQGRRPLVIFPEGAISRHQDILMDLMDGPSFIARQAVKRLAKLGSQREVVALPVAVRYNFEGDLEAAVLPDIEAFEKRFSWYPQSNRSLYERMARIGNALLTLKEIEYLGEARTGNAHDRAEELIRGLLERLEAKWKTKDRGEGIVSRVKNIRAAILPDLIAKKVTPEERFERWRDLAECYYVQQISHYPRNYLDPQDLVPERVIETIERFEEDFTDKFDYHGPMRCVIQVGEPIPVLAERDRTAEEDPLMAETARQLQSMLDQLAAEWKAG